MEIRNPNPTAKVAWGEALYATHANKKILFRSRIFLSDLEMILTGYTIQRCYKYELFGKKIMNTKIVSEASRATLEGTMPFPEIVGKLIETGVEYYHVDYVTLRKTFYSATGDTVITPITYDGLPSVAAEFDQAALRSAIIDSQRNGQHYREFTIRAMKAGVQGYFAFLRGLRVTYWGRVGDQHTEWFPGAEPFDPK